MNVPKLRFQEFNGNWEEKMLKDTGDFLGGGTPNTKNLDSWNGLIPWISSSDLTDESIYCIRKTRFITEEAITNSATKLIPKNSILIVSRVGVGKVAVSDCALCTSQDFTNLVPFTDNSIFLAYFIKIKTHFLLGFNQGTSIKGFVKSDLETLRLCLPSLNEQTKMASFFSSVDDKLSQLKKKKSLLEQYKKGVMQKIFSQELRFKDEDGNDFADWEEKKIGSICKITTGKLDANAMVENGEYRFYTCAKNYYQINKYAFDTEALLISGNGANVGYIHHYKGKFNAYQRTYVLDGFKENIIFIKYFLQQYLSTRINEEKKEGNTPYIVLSALSEMIVFIPTSTEQSKIANFFSVIDDKINQCGMQIEKMELWKKGLLQQMFV